MKWTEVADIFYLLHDHWELAADGSSFNSSSLTSTVAGFVFLEGKGGGELGRAEPRGIQLQFHFEIYNETFLTSTYGSYATSVDCKT